MTTYTQAGIRHVERIKTKFHPAIRGRDWARGRYHFRGDVGKITASKEQDKLKHMYAELLNLGAYLSPL